MLPNIKDAKLRTGKEVRVVYDAYNLNEYQRLLGQNKKYFLKTYGCQMNEHDSEKIKAMLESMGFIRVDDYEMADLVILNTCAIRENVHDKVFGMLGRFKHLKMHKPDLIVGMCGCMAQEEGVAQKIVDKYKFINFVFGTHNLHQLPDLLATSINEKKQVIEVWSTEGDVFENLPIMRDHKYKAWVNIMYGCDKFCTYCIVPLTRGKQRSRLLTDIEKEVEDLKKAGYQEVTLLGQNVNAYGKDLKDDSTMAKLLVAVAKTNISRVRFVTSHPWDFSDEMIEIIANYSNIMPYIHLPFQSGSNRILKLMGRRYTKEDYLTLVSKIRAKIPNVCLTTDIIVGFPGETDDEFNETIDVYKQCNFDLAYTFIYSPREGTPAAKIVDDVEVCVKERRLQVLNDLVKKMTRANNEKYLNEEVLVLLDSISHKDKTHLSGYTDTMKLVNVNASYEHLGTIAKVRITGVKTWSMDGEVVDDR